MNLFFHLASAVCALLLVGLLLKAQRQRDLLRELLVTQRAASAARRIHVEPAGAFLARFAAALGIPFDGAVGGAPRRIVPGPLTDLFLRSGISLIRCEETAGKSLRVELHVAAGGASTDAQQAVAAAFGGEVEVALVTAPDGAPANG